MEIATRLLCETGFSKRRNEIFTFELNEETIGWVGLNRAIHRGDRLLEVNPVVGVRHQPLERRIATLRKEKFHAYIPPTVSVHLGYLMPDRTYVPWLFSMEKDKVSLATKMVESLNEYGRPFMEANQSLEAICRTMETSGFGVPHQLTYRLPVAYFLLGNSRRAEEYLKPEERKLLGRTDLAAQQYLMFSKRLREHFSSVHSL